MAESKILKELEEQLNCSICLDTYTDPKLLQCFHVYCRKCLVPLVERDQQGKLSLTCPNCRQTTPIPDRGVAGLRPAFHINRLLEIKESCQEPNKPAGTPEEASPTDGNPVKKASHCLVHKGKKLKLYCETCRELICNKCALRGGSHHDHEYEELNQAFEKYKVDITPSLEPLEKQVTTIKKALKKFDAHCDEISNQRAATAGNIHTTFRRLREILNVRETELIDQLDRMTQSKLKSLAAQRDEIETSLAKLNSCLHFIRESLKPGNEGDVLMMKTSTANRAKELTTPFQPHYLEPGTEADMGFLKSVDMVAACQNYGWIYTQDLPDPSKCQVDAKTAVMIGEKYTTVLQLTNFKGQPCNKLTGALESEFVSEISGTRARCSVERRGQSQYEISYQPTIKGRHQLHVKVQGRHIRRSPFSVVVKSAVEKLGTPFQTIGWVDRPWGMAINQRREAVVAEWWGDSVSVFSPSGKKLRSFSTRGSGGCPREVAVDGEGNILVTDSENNRIQKFTSHGRFLTSVGSRSRQHMEFSLPTGIAFNASNNKVYVGDTNNHRIQVLNSDLTFSRTIGNEGVGEGQFSFPCSIACGSTGKVYVVDQCNHRIQVFSAEGTFQKMFGRRGQGRGELDVPVGIAVDASNKVYVSEWGNQRISVFTSGGQFVMSFGSRGEGPGEFMYPCGIAVDNNGVVYVCDRENYRIQVF
jgi:tripartite motif-containing protein 2/3/tripartite motif-containing protein 71